MTGFNADIGFTTQVKAEQQKRGSRDIYQRQVEQSDWKSELTSDLAGFIAQVDSFYLATASSDGQPYIQHRGGPRGFLKIIDEKTLAIADYAGNRQYITLGNLAENDKAYIFLMDYANQQRVKIWGTAKIIEDDAELLDKLFDETYRARPERALIFSIAAWDINCPQHIPKKFAIDDVELATRKLTQRIADLEAEVARLQPL